MEQEPFREEAVAVKAVRLYNRIIVESYRKIYILGCVENG